MSQPVIGIIEWASDSAREPHVVLGSTADDVRANLCALLASMLTDIAYLDDAWIAAHPQPDLRDAQAVGRWLDELCEQTTDGWVSLYTGGATATGTTYEDIRA